jgi:RimJ/RimL family protein N-acetyltransferase
MIPSEKHLDGLDALLNNPTMADWLGGLRSRLDILMGIREGRQHWEQHKFGPWVLVDSTTGEVVGRGGLRWAKVLGTSELELLYAVTPSYWGQGIATELARVALEVAFSKNVAVNSVVAFTTHGNKASQHILEKLGFEKETEFSHAGLPHVLFRITASQFVTSKMM